MPKYQVNWKEIHSHSAIVEAETKEEAVLVAIKVVNPVLTYKGTELEFCVELGEEDAEV